jgi:hypothetical protein
MFEDSQQPFLKSHHFSTCFVRDNLLECLRSSNNAISILEFHR